MEYQSRIFAPGQRRACLDRLSFEERRRSGFTAMPSKASSDTINRSAAGFVDASWIVADLLATWPQATPVFLRYKMNCVGCSMAAFETLGDALHIYGLDQEVFLAEVNAAISASIQF
jgi:hybrid cluster-associated redox disulfide protein